MFSQKIIDTLQSKRRETFAGYDNITLDRGALKVVAHLLLNPDCQSDIDITSFEGDSIPLTLLGEHIITAAPSTLAQYTEQHHLSHLTAGDVLKCFALDHIADIERLKIDINKNPQYALAHILNVSTVRKKYQLQRYVAVDLESPTEWGTVLFRKVIVPDSLMVDRNESVFHHFGVVVARATDSVLVRRIMKLQKHNLFMNALARENSQRDIVIDFSQVSIFHKDVVGQVMDHSKVQPINQPQDIKDGKVKFHN